MPIGLVVIQWDPRGGMEILTKYPEDVELSDKSLMQIFTTHEYTGESGVVNLTVGTINISSYYTGSDLNLYILLLLDLDDNPDIYESGLIEISMQIMANLKNDAYIKFIPSLFHRISIYPELTPEQILAMSYQDEITKVIINRLREEGVISKSELMVWLKDLFKDVSIDLDLIISELVKKEIVKEASVKGMPSELLFMINDLFICRIPPIKLFKNPIEYGLPEEFAKDYKIELIKFFKEYSPNNEDNKKLIDLIIDPQVNVTLKLLRQAIVTHNDLEKLKKKGVEDIDSVLKKLWDLKMIHVFKKDSGIEYYSLLNDLLIKKDFPRYQLGIIKNEYNRKFKPDKVLREYLSILRSTYLEKSRKSKKSKK